MRALVPCQSVLQSSPVGVGCRGFGRKAIGEMQSQPLQLDRCHRFSMSAGPQKPAYDIFVYEPDCPPPPDGFPVLCLLDANADFVLVVETMKRLSRRPGATGVVPAIVLGVGYSDTKDYARARRHMDMTAGPAALDAGVPKEGMTFGGFATFLEFLTGPLRQWVKSRYAVDENRHVLLGHSLAGYFVLETMLAHTELFSGYGAISPSVWWDRERLFRHLHAMRKDGGASIRFYSSVGGYEEVLPPWRQQGGPGDQDYSALRKARAMVANVRELSAAVATSLGERANVRSDLVEGEDHASAFVSCLPNALRFLLPAVV